MKELPSVPGPDTSISLEVSGEMQPRVSPHDAERATDQYAPPRREVLDEERYCPLDDKAHMGAGITAAVQDGNASRVFKRDTARSHSSTAVRQEIACTTAGAQN